MHLKRWITGIIAVPIVYFLIVAGQTIFALLIGAASVVTLFEYYRAAFPSQDQKMVRWIAALGLVLAPVIVWMVYKGHLAHVPLLISVNLVLVAGLTLPLFKDDKNAPHLVGKQVLGLVYIPLFLGFLTIIRADENGSHWIFWILCIVAAGDTGAFYSGRHLGRRKLCPWVSPKKTVEGSIGGLVANVLVALPLKLMWFPTFSMLACTIFALVMGAVGQVGDLFASEFKRAAGIKDSGTLLPGHGGFLDRLDALLFAAPLAYLFKIGVF